LVAGLGVALGCTGAGQRPPAAEPTEPTEPDQAHSALADEDTYKPLYGKAELEKVLIAERGGEASAERRLTELEGRPSDPATDDQVRVATADLAVRRRFIASLEACGTAGRLCPPRLDDPPWGFDLDGGRGAPPPMTAALRFDVEGWRALAAELHGRACACRTLGCVDSVGVAIDQLEALPKSEIEGDETASASITRARECLFRLRGRAIVRAVSPPED
jgi:hypothetical protein